MSVMKQAIRRRRNARMDERYIGTKRSKETQDKRLRRLITREKERVQRKAMKR